MTIHFIGAGPGAPDLITVRGRDLIAACAVCLYAGSLVPQALLGYCPEGARILNTAPMSLDEIIAEMARATEAGQDVARLSGVSISTVSSVMNNKDRASPQMRERVEEAMKALD